MPSSPGRALPLALLGVTLAAWLAQCVLLSWVAEDAFFALRMAENLASGHGLTWNPGWRVMVASCPLWVLALGALVAVAGRPCTTVLALAVALSFAMAVLLARRVAASPTSAALAILALGATRAVGEWTVSGLENPLSFLLLVAAVAGLRHGNAVQVLAACGLLATDRVDLALLVAPIAAGSLWRCGGRRRWAALAAGLAPLAAWEAFSLAWFGVPFANPMYAKVQTGIPLVERLQASWNHLRATLIHDPLTVVILAGGLLAAAVLRIPHALSVAAGVVAYLGTAAWVGGDYMLGRLFGAPAVLVVALLATRPLASRGFAAVMIAAVLAMGASARWRAARAAETTDGELWIEGTVNDTRAGAAPYTSPWSADRWPNLDHVSPRRPQRGVQVVGSGGHSAYTAGPEATVVDLWGIGDPLLARMPPFGGHWKPGHIQRAIPPGYLDSLRTGQNRITDPGLAHLYDLLVTLHRGPLWSRERLLAMVELNLTDTAEWTAGWEAPAPTLVGPEALPVAFDLGGLRVRFGHPVNATAVRLTVPARHVYTVVLMRAGRRVHRPVNTGADREDLGLAVREIALDDRVTRGGVDELRLSGRFHCDQEFRLEALDLVLPETGAGGVGAREAE